MQISADNTAAETGTVILTLKSQESGNRTLGKVTINYRLSTAATAAPALFYSPSFIETGVARDNSVTETVTLENRGLAALEGVQLALVKTRWQPGAGLDLAVFTRAAGQSRHRRAAADRHYGGAHGKRRGRDL